MTWTVTHQRAEDLLASLPAHSVDLFVTDPPYFSTGKVAAGDKQWSNAPAFLAWLDTIVAEMARVMRPNGSLYLFAAPAMAARVEVLIAERLNVLTRITWRKPPYSTKAEMFRKEDLRTYFPASEAIIFAEHYGSDNTAMGGAGYDQKCDELHGFVFEPVRAYLASERDSAGWTTRRVAEAFQKRTGSRTVTGMAGHWFERVQWTLPTAENYTWLQDLFNARGGDYLRREYEDLRRDYEDLRRDYEDLRRDYEDLRRDYEDLRRDYEDLRRPFSVTADVPYTDVWDFPTVGYYPGKHACEKPLAMMKHIVAASSRPGAVVCDPFVGSGATGVAAVALGRDFIGGDMNDHWAREADRRIAASLTPTAKTLPLFASHVSGGMAAR